MVPNARFQELLSDIEPSPTTVNNAAAAHRGVRGHLRAHADFKKRWVNDFLSGSYPRDTAIRPRRNGDGNERPDVDIIVVTNFTMFDAPEDVLEEVAKALSSGYTVKRINRRSVRIETSQADMDIVPVIASGDGYKIPDRDSGQWQTTNPPKHTDWARRVNSEFSDRFKPLVKLTKWWRRENPTASRRPKGFVLEVLTALHAPKNEAHYGEAFAQMLQNIYDTYQHLAAINHKPFLSDPAVPSNDVLSKISVNQWKEFLEKVRVYADYARRAQDASDHEKATELWRRVFGSRFRATGTAKAATSTATASAAGMASGYVFPAEPANSMKPRGFA